MPDPTHHDNGWICDRHGTRFGRDGSCPKWTHTGGILRGCDSADWRPLTADDDLPELAYADYEDMLAVLERDAP